MQVECQQTDKPIVQALGLPSLGSGESWKAVLTPVFLLEESCPQQRGPLYGLSYKSPSQISMSTTKLVPWAE